MATKEINRINEIAIDELKRSCDTVNASSDALRVKNLTFIAATFALLTYLYAGGDLFIPVEVYGRIFYFFGLANLIICLVIFLYSLRPTPWMLTTTIKKLKDIPEKTESEYLEYVKSEYIECYETNSSNYERKHRIFNFGFILLVVGAFVLLIIKTFPGNVRSCYTEDGTTCTTNLSEEGNKL